MRVWAFATFGLLLGCADSAGSRAHLNPSFVPTDAVADNGPARSTVTLGPLDVARIAHPITVFTDEAYDGTPPEPRLRYSAQLNTQDRLLLDFPLSPSVAEDELQLPEPAAVITLTQVLMSKLWRATRGTVRVRVEDEHVAIELSEVLFSADATIGSGTASQDLGPWSGEVEGDLVHVCQYLADAPPGSPQLADGTVNRIYVADDEHVSPFCREWGR